MSRPSVGVLITTFNRPEATDRCLASLVRAVSRAGIDAHVFLADASTDDATRTVVASYGDLVTVSRVDPSVHWARGMRLAYELMRRSRAVDYVLWLNDDVVLSQEALITALETLRSCGSVVLGAATRSRSGDITYAGFDRGPWWARLDFRRVVPGDSPVKCDALNGNFVLTPDSVDQLLGGFPQCYQHAIADLAFTLTARRRGVDVILAPDPIGFCETNAVDGSWLDRRLSRRARFRLLRQPRGLPPGDWLRFCLRYGGVRGPIYAVTPYVRVILRR